MMVQLEVGKKYRRRDGEVVKVISNDGVDTYPFIGSNAVTYQPNGMEYSDRTSDADLVEEVMEELTGEEQALEGFTEPSLQHWIGTPRPELIDPVFWEDLAKVAAFGVEKYGEDSYIEMLKEPGYARKRLGSLLRHIIAYSKGETADSETGLSHLTHACFNLMILHYGERNK